MSEWISVKELLPNTGVKVLAAYKNKFGNWRRVCAEYIHPRSYLVEDYYSDWAEYDSDYDEENDTYWVKYGWSERIDNWGEFTSVVICEGEVTYWQPLPEPPEGE